MKSKSVVVTVQPTEEEAVGNHHLPQEKLSPTSIAEGPAMARDVLENGFSQFNTESARFDALATNDPGFIGRFLASAEQKAVWAKDKLKTEMVGQARVTRIRMISETELRILATISEALVKSSSVGITRRFHDFVQGEINAMAANTEKHRRTFIAHVEERERMLATLSPRMRAPYEQSMEEEIAEHFRWFDTATSELITKLKERVVTYAGSIDG